MTYARCQTCGNTAVREPRVAEFVTRHVLDQRHSVVVQELGGITGHEDTNGPDTPVQEWYDDRGWDHPSFGPAERL